MNLIDKKDKLKYFFIGMGSAFNFWGDYYAPKRIKDYKKNYKIDTSVESVWRDVGDCFNWSISEFNNTIKQK